MAKPLLESSIAIAAPPAKVWSIVADLKRMGEFSPQCRKVIVFGGEIKQGALMLNVNKRGKLWWTTRARVVRFVPNTEIAFRISDNRTVWSYLLTAAEDGTTLLTERREVPTTTAKTSQVLIKLFFGGAESFDDELVDGMKETLGKIKIAAER